MFINRPHDLLSPENSVGYRSNGRRHTSSAVVLCQLSSRKDSSHDPQHTFAALIHPRILAHLSLLIRY